ncbi:MAG: hypothetical protein IT168_12800 [Bryobacterales bacterium]|nr:hypothetical protein [Bryobacterales bacterium]
MPEVPKKLADVAAFIKAHKVTETNLKTLETLAKLSKESAAIAAVNAAKQKMGNYLQVYNQPAKKDAATKFAGEVFKLYNAAVDAVDKAPLPTGKWQVKLKTYTRPQFMHNATAAGKLPEWTFECWDTGQPNMKKQFVIKMTTGMSGDENSQTKQMNEAAKAQVKTLTKASDVTVTT